MIAPTLARPKRPILRWTHVLPRAGEVAVELSCRGGIAVFPLHGARLLGRALAQIDFRTDTVRWHPDVLRDVTLTPTEREAVAARALELAARIDPAWWRITA